MDSNPTYSLTEFFLSRYHIIGPRVIYRIKAERMAYFANVTTCFMPSLVQDRGITPCPNNTATYKIIRTNWGFRDPRILNSR